MNDNLDPSLTGSATEDAVLLAASCVTIATLVPVLLYQTGAIRSLPDPPPSSLFASDKITKSKMAHPFGIPDTIPGLLNFGATLALILLARKSRVARRVLGAKLLLDGSAAAFNASRQVVGFGKLCSWCTGTALAAGVTVVAGRRIVSDTLSGNWSGDAATLPRQKRTDTNAGPVAGSVFFHSARSRSSVFSTSQAGRSGRNAS